MVAWLIPRANMCLVDMAIRMALNNWAERKITEVQLESLSHYDALTSLANRNLFLTNLEHDLAIAARTDRPLAVLCLDLDGFEAVNHAIGHHAGITSSRRSLGA